MKKIFITIFLVVLLSVTSSYATEYRVLKVLDGDTVFVDFNGNHKAESEERVRVNGIDAFETKLNPTLKRQAKNNGITVDEALKLGYLGKQFAMNNLLHKKVQVVYSAEIPADKYNRPLVSIYYNCDKYGTCKNYEQEILRAGLANIYYPSNLRTELDIFENPEKMKENALASKDMELVVLNKRSGAYHKTTCEYGWMSKRLAVIEKPKFSIRKHPASCCFEVKQHHKEKKLSHKPFTKIAPADVTEGDIQLFFLSPLEQKRPVNKCVTNACKALVYNIDHAQESIDFAIYGIRKQDEVFAALVQAQQRGVKVRWVTDMNEKEQNIYSDTYKLMKYLPAYNTDFDAQKNEVDITTNFKIPHKAIMHDKFFIFDNKKVFTGSTNISDTCLTGYNSNIAVLIDNSEVAKVFSQEFEQMYNGNFHNQKTAISDNENIQAGTSTVSVYFSPLNKTGTEQIIPLIQSAKDNIYVPVYYMTRSDIIDELIYAKQRGIDVKIIVDESSIKGQYVDIDYMKKNGVDVKIEHWRGMMHMKSIIIDNSTLIIGSMNFTKQGEQVNDENCLIIKNAPILTAAYKAHFLDLWNSIR